MFIVEIRIFIFIFIPAMPEEQCFHSVLLLCELSWRQIQLKFMFKRPFTAFFYLSFHSVFATRFFRFIFRLLSRVYVCADGRALLRMIFLEWHHCALSYNISYSHSFDDIVFGTWHRINKQHSTHDDERRNE